MNAQDTANNIFIFVDFNAESQHDLLGDSGTNPVGIRPFQFDDCVDEFLIRSFRARPTFVLGRKQHEVLSFGQHSVEMQEEWKASKERWRNVEGGFMTRAHKPAMIRSSARRLRAHLRPRLRMCS